jgi:hypothetical protein
MRSSYSEVSGESSDEDDLSAVCVLPLNFRKWWSFAFQIWPFKVALFCWLDNNT